MKKPGLTKAVNIVTGRSLLYMTTVCLSIYHNSHCYMWLFLSFRQTLHFNIRSFSNFFQIFALNRRVFNRRNPGSLLLFCIHLKDFICKYNSKLYTVLLVGMHLIFTSFISIYMVNLTPVVAVSDSSTYLEKL